MKLADNPLLAEMDALKGYLSSHLSSSKQIISAQQFGLSGSLEGVQSNRAGTDFSKLFSQALNKVNQLQASSSHLSTQMELGNPNVTLSDTVIVREKASVAFEATLQVRNKLLEAYKEIMSMPV